MLLLIEISAPTLNYDRDTKVPMYARTNILEVWIVDLRNDRLRVYREPENGEYRYVEVLRRDMNVVPVNFPELQLTVAEILGAPVTI